MGAQLAGTREWLIAGPSAIAAVAICLAVGGATRGRPRAALLGVAAGIAFGVSALLTKALVHYLGDGIFAWVPHWEPYALAVAAIGGVIIAQSALQTGALGAAVGSIESMSVISGSLFGLFLLDERVGAHGFVRDLGGRRVDRRDPRWHPAAVARRGARARAFVGARGLDRASPGARFRPGLGTSSPTTDRMPVSAT